MPVGDREPLARGSDHVEQGVEALAPMRWQGEGARNCVQVPPKETLLGAPVRVTLREFLDGGGLFSESRVMKGGSQQPALMPLSLSHEQKIIHVHISFLEWCRGAVAGELGGVPFPRWRNQNRGVIRWRRVGSGLQTMLRELSILAHGLVRQVTCCFGVHGEVGRAFHPTHGKGERKGNEGDAPLAW